MWKVIFTISGTDLIKHSRNFGSAEVMYVCSMYYGSRSHSQNDEVMSNSQNSNDFQFKVLIL